MYSSIFLSKKCSCRFWFGDKKQNILKKEVCQKWKKEIQVLWKCSYDFKWATLYIMKYINYCWDK